MIIDKIFKMNFLQDCDKVKLHKNIEIHLQIEYTRQNILKGSNCNINFSVARRTFLNISSKNLTEFFFAIRTLPNILPYLFLYNIVCKDFNYSTFLFKILSTSPIYFLQKIRKNKKVFYTFVPES